jgi:hypothetical protein
MIPSKREIKEGQNKKERIKMKSKTKSDKTRLSDLAAKKDARGGRLPEAPYPDGGPSGASGIATPHSASSLAKKHLTKYPPPSA